MSSARDITRAAWPPRSVYLDYPLGHTSGKPHEPELNQQILRDTLAALENLRVPGSMAHLPYRWSDSDRWKDRVFAPSTKAEELPECAVPTGDGSAEASAESSGNGGYEDDRVERHPTPQYQSEDDAAAARASHDGEECLVCAGIDY
ncbi:MAG: hypothetical protein OXF65_10570 [Acidimicrobiaceae bacterium]|nr:hypothetical protein [Acidimicrobiaceae bacterium]